MGDLYPLGAPLRGGLCPAGGTHLKTTCS
ncbi:MAG: hypothetical protein Q9N34_08005 [Aquificota bacterium]|nr:hypothetical protein [Aquificota bacterium]